MQHQLWHIDQPLSRPASGFNTATSQHVNSSKGYTSYLLCPKVTAISPLWTAQITRQPSRREHPTSFSTNISPTCPSCLRCTSTEVLPFGSPKPNGCVGLFFSLTRHICLELINVSLLLLGCTCDECGDGLDLLSEGGLSLSDGLYLRLNASAASSAPKWETHTAGWGPVNVVSEWLSEVSPLADKNAKAWIRRTRLSDERKGL